MEKDGWELLVQGDLMVATMVGATFQHYYDVESIVRKLVEAGLICIVERVDEE